MFASDLPSASSTSSVPEFLKQSLDNLFSQLDLTSLTDFAPLSLEAIEFYQPKIQDLQFQIQHYSSLNSCEDFLLNTKTALLNFALSCPPLSSEETPDRAEYICTIAMLSLAHDGLTDLLAFAALVPSLSDFVPPLGVALGALKERLQKFEWTFVKNTAKNWMSASIGLSRDAQEFKQLHAFLLKYSRKAFCDLLQIWDEQASDFALNVPLHQECLRFHMDLQDLLARSLIQNQSLQENSFEALSMRASQSPGPLALAELKNWIAINSPNGRLFSSVLLVEERSSHRLPNRPLIQKVQSLGESLAIFDPAVEQHFIQFEKELQDLVSRPMVTISPIAHALSKDSLLLSEFAEDLATKVKAYNLSLIRTQGFACAQIRGLESEIAFYQAICEQQESPARSPSSSTALFSPHARTKMQCPDESRSGLAPRILTPLRASPIVFSPPSKSALLVATAKNSPSVSPVSSCPS